jgi:hypothetical protein
LLLRSLDFDFVFLAQMDKKFGRLDENPITEKDDLLEISKI